MNIRNRIAKLLTPVCNAIDEMLYGRQLAIARWHQAEIDRILGEIAERSVPDDENPAGGQS
jgi:hypothetical protein